MTHIRIHALAIAIAAAACLPRFGAFAAPADGNGLPAIRPLMVLQPTAASTTQYDLLVYGDIGDSWWGESVTALSVVQQLQALDAGITQINVRINSYGGSVSDGIAIYNALKRHSARKVVTVDGVAMSSASLIAMAGDEIQMPATSLMMIHAPWGMAQGNAQDMRVMADVLDTYASAMAGAYAAKTGKPKADMLALLADGVDHYYTGEQAVAEGFADKLVDAAADTGGDAAQQDAAARAAGVGRMLAAAPDNIRQLAIAAAARHPTALPKASTPHLRLPEGMDMQSLQNALASASGQRALVTALTTAASATDGELTMKLRKLFAAMASLRDPAHDATDGGHGGGGGAPADTAAVHAALRTRNDEIRAVLEPYKARTGIAALLLDSLTDPTATVDSVRAKALALVGNDASPSAQGNSRIEMGDDETDKIRAAGTDYLLARAGILKGDAAVKARQGNPFNGNTMMDMARSFAARGGVVVQGMDRSQIIASAITHSTSDFSIVLENALHKTVINAYNQMESTWQRICSIGTLSDFRAHNRYYLSSFSDLKEVQQNGEYEDSTINDAEKETITGKTKGRILNLSREIIINDDMGVFTQVAVKLGQAAGRTIEKDVYALLALNSGAGPTMSDGNPLFHASHNNIAGTAAAPSVDSFDAAKTLMGRQKDPGSNDYIGIRPAIWLGPLELSGQADVVNASQYDPDAANKLQRKNKSYQTVRDIVDTPRLSGTPWYMLADPAMEPVLEVGFLDGNQLPTIVAEDSFRSNGRAWRVSHDYGVAAIGYRGAVKNPGA